MYRDNRRFAPTTGAARVLVRSLGSSPARTPSPSRLALAAGLCGLLALHALPAHAAFRSSASSERAAAAGWQAERHAPLPVGRARAAAVGVGTDLYVAGGESRRGLSGRVDHFDARSGTWRLLTDRVTPRKDLGAVVLDGELYLVGGETSAGPCSDVEIVDLETGRVRRGPSLPTPRSRAGVAVHEGRLWVAGGTLGWGHLATVEIFDPARQSWFRGPLLAEARDPALVEVEGALFALGGRSDAGASTRVERLDDDGRAWETVADLPAPFAGLCAVAVDDEVFVFGDDEHPGRALRMSPRGGRWTWLRGGLTPRSAPAAANVGGRAVLIGGAVRGPSDLVESLVPRR